VKSRRVPIASLAVGQQRLDGALAHYLVRVLRLRAGDTFVAFDTTSSFEADATAVWAEDDAITVQFGALREAAVRTSRGLTWIQGLAKGDKCDAVVRDATELGATRLVVVSTKRSVVKLERERSEARQARWARIAEQAARQSGRGDVPLVDSPCAWPAALARVDATDARFCLWEQAIEPLAPRLFDALAQGESLAFACGAEGGLDEDEVSLARAQGWIIVTLGPRMLRTETVAAAVLGAVQVWTGLFER
jgi:16S rRNA (uracil1498-N3)-methyltransferase